MRVPFLCLALAVSVCAFPTALLVADCTPTTPQPVSPTFDAADGASLTPCQAACAAAVRVGCAMRPNCPQTFEHIERAHQIRTSDGRWLTCARLAGAQTYDEWKAIGIGCDVAAIGGGGPAPASP
jgi:hypothetical protein